MTTTKILSYALLSLIVSAVMTGLGFWQLQRAEDKQKLHDLWNARQDSMPINLNQQEIKFDSSMLYRIAHAEGHYLPELTIMLDNRIHRGQPGVEIFTPFQLAGSDEHILVNRGWQLWSGDRSIPPALPALSSNHRDIVGTLVLPNRPGLLLADEHPGSGDHLWQSLNIEHYALIHQLKITPYLLQIVNDSNSELDMMAVILPVSGITRHQGYALQWFLMACTVWLLYFIYIWRKRNTYADTL